MSDTVHTPSLQLNISLLRATNILRHVLSKELCSYYVAFSVKAEYIRTQDHELLRAETVDVSAKSCMSWLDRDDTKGGKEDVSTMLWDDKISMRSTNGSIYWLNPNSMITIQLHQQQQGMRRSTVVGETIAPLECLLRERKVELHYRGLSVCLLHLQFDRERYECTKCSHQLSPGMDLETEPERTHQTQLRSDSDNMEWHLIDFEAILPDIGSAVSCETAVVDSTVDYESGQAVQGYSVIDDWGDDNNTEPGNEQTFDDPLYEAKIDNDGLSDTRVSTIIARKPVETDSNSLTKLKHKLFQSLDAGFDVESELFLPPHCHKDTIIPSLLPSAIITSRVNDLSRTTITQFSGLCDRFTHFEQLRTAQNDAEFDSIRANITSEWQDVRTTLLIIAAADAAVYGFSSGTLFTVDQAASRCLILSAITAAFGLCLVTGLQLRYLHADARRFATLARGSYNEDYLSFSITSRVPLLALCMSLGTFTIFLLAVAYGAWPSAVLVLGMGGAALVSFQHIIKGLAIISLGVAGMVCGSIAALRRAYTRVNIAIPLSAISTRSRSSFATQSSDMQPPNICSSTMPSPSLPSRPPTATIR